MGWRTLNLENQDPHIGLNCVPLRPQTLQGEAVLSNAFGFGGTNVALGLPAPLTSSPVPRRQVPNA